MLKIKQKLWVKTIAVVLFVIFALSAILCGFGTIMCFGEDFYTKDTKTVQEDFLSSISWRFMNQVEANLVTRNSDGSLIVSGWGTESESYFDYIITDCDTGEVLATSIVLENAKSRYTLEQTHVIYKDIYDQYNELVTSKQQVINIKIMVKEFPKGSVCAIFENIYMTIYNNRFLMIIYTLLFIIISTSIFAFLMGAVGFKKGFDTVQSGFFEKIPFDILTIAITAILIILSTVFVLIFDEYIDSVSYAYLTTGTTIYGLCLELICMIAIILTIFFWCRCLAVRIKLKNLFKGMCVYNIFSFVLGYIKKAIRFVIMLIRSLPLMWKTAMVLAIISIIEMAVLLMYGNGEIAILWFLEKIIIIPTVLLVVVNLKKLQKGGEMLANGDISKKINTEFMFWEFKKHAQNLNSIGDGINKAVDARTKSERFKTELITNVSHDIKTPLTSIINYVDLLKKENPENEKSKEYIDVLERQSGRLKKLIEDLVEASKASSGSVAVNLKPCNIDIVIAQALGEYQDKLKSNNLELIVKKANENILVMADGRHLWRVFDNLFNNICKHALGGSRVYLSLEQIENQAVITFKNISKYELDISSDELMERFVRGDKSRNTEGSGLGLSIAKSLTELQGGEFNLQIDGDLFKAILCFAVIKK